MMSHPVFISYNVRCVAETSASRNVRDSLYYVSLQHRNPTKVWKRQSVITDTTHHSIAYIDRYGGRQQKSQY